MKRFLSVPEAAARFEVTSQTVRNWIASGRLAAVQPTRRGRFRIPCEAFRAFEHEADLSDRPDSTQARTRGLDSVDPAADRRGTRGSTTIDGELERVVAAIVGSVHPQAILLFGSRARGDFTLDSDLDLAIVAPDGSERRRVAMQAYESIAAVDDRSVGVDLVVLTPRIILAERDLVGSVVRAVMREGVPVYGSTAIA